METDEDTNNNEHAANQRSEQKGRPWSREETQYMLRMYNKYINDIGRDKKFRSKLHLWNDITKNLNRSFQMQRTTVQCIGRFKTLQHKNSNGSNNNNRAMKSSVAQNELSSSDDNAEMQETSDTDQPFEIAEVIRSTLLEIHGLKEEAKERRHRERMNLLEKFLHPESVNAKVTAQPESELMENKNEVVRPAVLAAQQPSENDNQSLRARLLEMQRKKMEDRERKQKVSMTPKQQRLSVRNLK